MAVNGTPSSVFMRITFSATSWPFILKQVKDVTDATGSEHSRNTATPLTTSCLCSRLRLITDLTLGSGFCPAPVPAPTPEIPLYLLMPL